MNYMQQIEILQSAFLRDVLWSKIDINN